jgi:hypothetical protein
MTQRIKQFFSRDPESDTPSSRSWSGTLDVKTLLDTFLKPNEVNMDRFAAIEAVNAMLAYYKVNLFPSRLHGADASLQVGLKNVVDAFTMYAVEECLLSRMSTIFTPESVYTLDDKTITRIAGESEQSIAERESLSKKLTVLKDTQKILHRMDRHKPGGRSVPNYSCRSHGNIHPSVAVVEPEARPILEPVAEPFELQSMSEAWEGSSQAEYVESVNGEEEVLEQEDNDQRENDYEYEEPEVADEQDSESSEASSEPLKIGRVTAAIERFEKLLWQKGRLRNSIRATTELMIETFTSILESLHDLPLSARDHTRKLLIRVKAYASTIDDYVSGFISMERFDRMLGRLPVIDAAYLDWTVWREEVLNCAFHVADILLHNRAFRG